MPENYAIAKPHDVERSKFLVEGDSAGGSAMDLMLNSGDFAAQR